MNATFQITLCIRYEVYLFKTFNDIYDCLLEVVHEKWFKFRISFMLQWKCDRRPIWHLTRFCFSFKRFVGFFFFFFIFHYSVIYTEFPLRDLRKHTPSNIITAIVLITIQWLMFIIFLCMGKIMKTFLPQNLCVKAIRYIFVSILYKTDNLDLP